MQDVLAVVTKIEIFTTKLSTPQNKEAIIPNGTLSNRNIINSSSRGTLRVDLTIGIGYGDDIKKAKEVLINVLTDNPKALKDPTPNVAFSELGDNAINLVVRPYTTVADYWNVYFSVLEDSKNALDGTGISIPYPQRDVHMHNLN
ncbi:mechanosensitive ion channel family protein [Aquimarina sp. M1]